MLAAERRPEMGMARAVGTHRRQLIQQFIAEGSGYALLAGLVGAALGVAATYGIAFGLQGHLRRLCADRATCLATQPDRRLLPGRGHHLPDRRRLVLEDQPPQHRRGGPRHPRRYELPGGRRAAWSGADCCCSSVAWLTMSGLGAEQSFPFYAGMSLLPFGVALIVRFFGVSSRLLFS